MKNKNQSKWDDFCCDCRNVFTEKCEICKMKEDKFNISFIGEELSIKYPTEYEPNTPYFERVRTVRK